MVGVLDGMNGSKSIVHELDLLDIILNKVQHPISLLFLFIDQTLMLIYKVTTQIMNSLTFLKILKNFRTGK